MAPRAFYTAGGDCYLPDCGVTVSASPLPGFGLPSEFGPGGVTTGGIPHGYPKPGQPFAGFAPSAPKRYPVETLPKTRPPGAPAGPTAPQIVPEEPYTPPVYDPQRGYVSPDPLGEMPATYRSPGGQLPAVVPDTIPSIWRIFNILGRLFAMDSPLMMLTQAADLGYSAPVEAFRVAQFLETSGIGTLPAGVNPVSTTGYVDALTLPQIEITPGLAPFEGELTVTGTRPATATHPLASPELAPGVFQQLSPLADFQLATPTPLALRAVTAQGTGTRVGLRPGQSVRPTVDPYTPIPYTLPKPFPLTGVGVAQATLPYTASPSEAGPGSRPSSKDCEPSGKKQQQKKRKKRNVCYRGTYEERANGLLKWRKERIQCR